VLILQPNPSTHLTLEWGVPALRGFYEKLASRAQLVRLDYRGTGLSERAIGSLSAEDVQVDITTVLDKLGLGQVAIYTWGFGCTYAIRFAVGNPERVSRLALAEVSAPIPSDSLNRTIAGLRRVNPEVQVQTRANLIAGWSDHENATGLAALITGAIDTATIPLWLRLISSSDVSKVAAQVQAPALLIHAQDDVLFPIAGAQSLAALLPNAQMRIIPGAASLGPFTDSSAVEAALDFLLDGGGSASTRKVPPVQAVPPIEALSARELEVLRLIAAGRTNEEIARALFISPSTVSHHVSNILAKTGAANRTEAAAYAHHERLL
jgi:DNA-binding CsgD family transcriptional regulator